MIPLTGIDIKEKYTKYKIEDTSGAVQCVHWGTLTDNSTSCTRYCLGDLVCVTAKITEFRGNVELKIMEIFEMVG